MKKIIQITWMLLLGLKLSGQVGIDSVYTIPLFPTAEDTIRVVGAIRTSSAGCDLIGTALEIDEVNGIVAIKGCYYYGPMDTICPSIDTFLVGQLQAGVYQINFIVSGFEFGENPSVDCFDPTDEVVAEILVSGTNGADSKKEQLFQFSLIENPVGEYATFRIKPIEVKPEIVIVDNLGRIVIKKKIEDIPGQEIKVEVKQLPPGIYYCYLENDSGKSKTLKFIKK